MRLLVALHHLEIGGSQLNALDMAVAARGRGHEVFVLGAYSDEPGPVASLVREAGLPLTLIQHPRDSPELRLYRGTIRKGMTDLVAREHIDVVHAYEIPMILDALFGPHLRLGVPLTGTIYGHYVPWWLPRYPPLVVGAKEIGDKAAPHRPQPPVVIEPPVNTEKDNAALVDADSFRRAHGLDGEILLGIVSRVEPFMKADGIEMSMRAVQLLNDQRIQLAVTGDGPSFGKLSAVADQVNEALGRRAVVMTGALADPRPAYAAADIALGMGGSALRSMAFGKPLIVLGLTGFAKPLQPSTADEFLSFGFYGIGDGNLDPTALAGYIRELVGKPDQWSELGSFGNELIWRQFSLKAAAATLDEVYGGAMSQPYPLGRRGWESLRVAACKTGSDMMSDRIKGWFRPLARAVLQRSGNS